MKTKRLAREKDVKTLTPVEVGRDFGMLLSGLGIPHVHHQDHIHIVDEVPGWEPAVSIKETAGGYTLTAELPGVDRKDIKVAVKDGVLAVTGKRQGGSANGAFAGSFVLPENVKAEGIKAVYKDGLLTLNIPRIPSVKKPSLEISVG